MQDPAGLGIAFRNLIGLYTDEEGAELDQPFLKRHSMEYRSDRHTGSSKWFRVQEPLSKQVALNLLSVTVIYDRSGKKLKRVDGFTAASAIEAAVQQAL